MTEDKIILHDIAHCLQPYHIIIFTETGTEHDNPLFNSYFPRHTAFHLHSTARSIRGSGITILVSAQYAPFASLWRVDASVSCMWVRITKEGTRLDRDLFIGGCYVPPCSSAQVASNPLRDRFLTLLQHTAQATAVGHVILTGDFNARIASESDMPEPPPPHVVPCLRGCTDVVRNPAGQLFLDTCMANHLAILTGRAEGDVAAPNTFHGSNGSSRPDHVAVDYELFRQVVSQRVMACRLGSDHSPIITVLTVLAPPPRVLPRLAPPPYHLGYVGSGRPKPAFTHSSSRQTHRQLSQPYLPHSPLIWTARLAPL